jgi:hypothetical protein
MLNIFLSRLHDTGKETLGVMRIYKGLDKILECKTLEPSWKDNQKGISCIPSGTYNVELRESPKFGLTPIIKGIVNRDLILIHKGNYAKDTKGCVLVGSDFGDINKDGEMDLVGSKIVFDQIMQLLSREQSVIKIL